MKVLLLSLLAICFLSNIAFAQNNVSDSQNGKPVLSTNQKIILGKELRVKVANPDGSYNRYKMWNIYSLDDAKKEAKRSNAKDFSYDDEYHYMDVWGQFFDFGQTCNCKKKNIIIIYKFIADSDSIVMKYENDFDEPVQKNDCPDGTLFILLRKQVEQLIKFSPTAKKPDAEGAKEKMRKLLK